MKNFLLLFAVICILALSGPSLATANRVSLSHNEKAIVEFKNPVKLMHVTLQGEYLFVHDDAKMEAGENCTYVYKSEAGMPGKLVISFHCIPVPREAVTSFTVRTSPFLTKPVIYELTEYQFAGSNEGHQVPSRHDAMSGIVDLVIWGH